LNAKVAWRLQAFYCAKQQIVREHAKQNLAESVWRWWVCFHFCNSWIFS